MCTFDTTVWQRANEVVGLAVQRQEDANAKWQIWAVITRFVITRFVIARFIVTRFIVARFVVTRFVVTRLIVARFIVARLIVARFIIPAVAASQHDRHQRILACFDLRRCASAHLTGGGRQDVLARRYHRNQEGPVVIRSHLSGSRIGAHQSPLHGCSL